jgi:hypothetical protein
MSQEKKSPSALHNWISMSGMVMTAGSVFAFLFLFALELISGHSNAYIGILTYLVAPAFFLLGLVLVLTGWLVQRWLHARRGVDLSPLTLNLSDPKKRRPALVFIGCALVFLLLSAAGSYQTYHITESNAFCGEVCHEVMEPEYEAYQHSPHANIACTECHIGSGASWYLKSKINGLHQVYAVLTDSFHRPIDTPLPNLRPPEDICMSCHWPSKYVGNVEKSYDVVLSDEENTRFSYRLVLDVGGGDREHGPVGGIHWHMHIDNTMEFVALDDDKMDIPWVRMTHADGESTVYQREGFELDPEVHTLYRMNCMDCHNRPSHRFTPPNEAIDRAFLLDEIPAGLPNFKYTAVSALTGDYATEQEAHDAIAAALTAAYGEGPEAAAAVAAVEGIYSRNFFPRMNVRWDVYPEHIGHKNSPGCFRCHDGDHVSETGAMIGASDCNSCHRVIAQKTGDEAWQMSLEGLEFAHPDGDFIPGLACTDCHTGGLQL